MGFAEGAKGRAGLVLAVSLGTLIPAYAVLPSSIPNLALAGEAEKLHGITFSYSDYLWFNFPALAVLIILGLPVMITLLLPARSNLRPERTEARMCRDEKSLMIILLAALMLWMMSMSSVSPIPSIFGRVASGVSLVLFCLVTSKMSRFVRVSGV